MEAPTGTLLFNYKDIKQEIVHTLLLEKYCVSRKWVIIMDKRQDQNAASTQAETFGSGPGPRRRLEETAWKRRRIKTSLVIVMFLLGVMTYVVFYINSFEIELVMCDLFLTRFDLTKDLLSNLTLSSLLFFTNCVVVMTKYLNPNPFQYQ